MEHHDEIADPETGLFSEAYLHSLLPTRVAAARRGLRPLGVAVVEVDPGDVELAAITEAVRSTLRDSDTPCRLSDGRYALILEDTSVGGCRRAVERVRDLLDEQAPTARHWAGIACYPAHAFQEDDLLRLAEQALVAARQDEGGTVVMADAPDE